MISGPALENLTAAVVRLCRSGLDPDRLRTEVLPRVRSAVPIDALWWSAVDPATLLFTRAYREELPAESGPYFVANEFLQHDVNKWTELARDRDGVRTLMQATNSQPATSRRYQDIFAPLGLQDELRAVLRQRGQCWGYICLHREGPQQFSPDEIQFMQRIAPHLGAGIRLGLVRQACELDAVPNGPGLLLVAADGTVVGTNQAAHGWLDELGGSLDRSTLPVEILALATQLRHQSDSSPTPPRLMTRTKKGRWAVLHASWMSPESNGTVAVIIDEATPSDAAPLIMTVYGLTDREQQITALVCQGRSTKEIAGLLHLTIDTVQQHLTSVFDRTGVRSRGELAAAILQRDYLPRAMKGTPLTRTGGFAN